MKVICNRAGQGDGCSDCPHAKPHEWRVETACDLTYCLLEHWQERVSKVRCIKSVDETSDERVD